MGKPRPLIGLPSVSAMLYNPIKDRDFMPSVFFPSKVKKAKLPVVLAHEQYCLDSIRGQAFSATELGMAALSEVTIPH